MVGWNLVFSLFWRVGIFNMGVSLLLTPFFMYMSMNLEGVSQVTFRPIVGLSVGAVFVWIVGAASPRFLRDLFWGGRLNLSIAQWTVFSRGLAVSLLVMAVALNVAMQLLKEEWWINFKLFFLPILLVFFVAIIVNKIRSIE